MYKNIKELPKDVQAKLSEAQQTAFLEAFNASVAETESEKLRTGWEAAVRTNSRIVHHAFLFRPGNWDAAGGDGKITEKNIDDAVYAMNKCTEMGVPVALKYDHSDDKRSIPAGIVQNAIKEDGSVYGDLYVLQDACADLDGTGSKTLVTIDQMADALLTGGMQLSVEAFPDVKIPSYYGDRTISMEPSAMAILPAGVAPAVTKKLVAGRDKYKSVSILASKETHEGGTKMELEELTKLVEELVVKVEALEKGALEDEELEKDEKPDPTIAELEKSNKDLQAKLDNIETEKLTAEVGKLTEEVTEKMLPEQAKNLKAELEKTADLSEKKVVLSRLNAIIEEPADSERKLKAGREKSESKKDKYEVAVKKEMDDHGVSRFVAQRTINESMTDDEFETEEV